jgi:hypothetical protein
MSEIKIITNHHVREVLHDWNLTKDQRAEFDYIDWDACERGEDSASFVMYKGNLYDLGDTEGIPTGDLAGWDSYITDSFFSGTLFRYFREDDGEIDGDYVICAWFYVKG